MSNQVNDELIDRANEAVDGFLEIVSGMLDQNDLDGVREMTKNLEAVNASARPVSEQGD